MSKPATTPRISSSAPRLRWSWDLGFDLGDADTRRLLQLLTALLDTPALGRAAVAAGFQVDLVPEQYVAESLVAAFKDFDLQNKRILLPRAAIARDLVPDELRRLGARVDVVEAYRTGLPPGVQERAAKIFAAGRKPDWITFTSSSTVNNFIAAAGREALAGVRVASIGPVTSATLRSHGVEVTAEAAAYTAEGLVEAIISSR